jgi:hypothetical protein
MEFEETEEEKSILVADGFINLSFPDGAQSSKQGIVDESKVKVLYKSKGYQPVNDFKEDKIEVWVLDNMYNPEDTSQQKSKIFNLQEYGLRDKFETSKALNMFREN